MNDVPIELLQEIGLYLDPKSYYRLRNSFQTQLPLQQRILPCYFDYPNVSELLRKFVKKHASLDDMIKLTELDTECIRKLLENGCWDILVPFCTRGTTNMSQFLSCRYDRVFNCYSSICIFKGLGPTTTFGF